MDLAPIVLFVYNRPKHTLQALESLMTNDLADKSELFIYADGPKESVLAENLQKIQETRQVIRKKKWCKEVTVFETDMNKGLANSVIDGVTEIVNKYEKVIVLEDDLILSKYFLDYINNGLDHYGNCDDVMQISGYLFPTNCINSANQSFFIPLATSWGWATWKRAWSKFDVKAEGYLRLRNDKELAKKFDLDNSYPYSKMLILQMEKNKLNSWAVKWWWNVFNNNGLVLYPDKTLVNNIGWDGSGVHCGKENPFMNNYWDKSYSISEYPKQITINRGYFNFVKEYLSSISNPARKKNTLHISQRIVNKIKRLLSF